MTKIETLIVIVIVIVAAVLVGYGLVVLNGIPKTENVRLDRDQVCQLEAQKNCPTR